MVNNTEVCGSSLHPICNRCCNYCRVINKSGLKNSPGGCCSAGWEFPGAPEGKEAPAAERPWPRIWLARSFRQNLLLQENMFYYFGRWGWTSMKKFRSGEGFPLEVEVWGEISNHRGEEETRPIKTSPLGCWELCRGRCSPELELELSLPTVYPTCSLESRQAFPLLP